MSVEISPEQKIEQKPEVVWAYSTTRNFLLEAQVDGAIDRYLDKDLKPLGRQGRVPPLARYRGEDLGLTVAYFASEFSTREIIERSFRKSSPITRERFRQIINSTLEGIWDETNPELQKKYPLDQIPKNKPRNSHIVANMSLGSSGTFARVLEMCGEGASYEDLVEAMGSGRDLGSPRSLLRKYGVEVPYSEYLNPKYLEQKERLLTDKDMGYEELKTFYGVLSSGQTRGLLQYRPEWVISIFDCSGLAGLFLRANDVPLVREVLERSEIPLATYEIAQKDQKTHVGSWMRRADLDRALEVLRTDPSLDKYRKKPA